MTELSLLKNRQNDSKCINEMYSGLFRSITSEKKVSEPIENNVYVIEQKNGKNLFFGGFTPKNIYFAFMAYQRI